MKFDITKLMCRTLFVFVALLLAACGGSVGSAGSQSPGSSYTVGGTVAGLSGTVVLQNNHGDNLSVTGNAFTFANPVASGGAYGVTVLTQPSGQSCSVANGTGTISSAAVTNVIVNCAATVPTISVTVSPAAASVAPSGTRAFTATVAGTTNTAVTWSVQEGATGGSITGTGQYTAPSHAGVYHVIATSNADATKSGSATITVNEPPPANGAAMTTANRVSGVAPLAVFFDAVDTANEGSGGTPLSVTSPPNWPFTWTSGVFQPADMEGSQFEWWFDDPSSGVWANDGLSKNTATGFTAAHVFETPGNYIVTLRVTSSAGRVDTYQQTITVTEFAGVTHYASASGTGDGTSASSPQSLSSGWSWVTGAPGRRLLLNRGDTFSLSGTLSVPTSRAGLILGAYGTGARPVLSYSGTALDISSPDVTIMDVDVTAPSPVAGTGIIGEATQRQDRLLILRSKITNHSEGVGTNVYASTITNPNSGMVFQEVETDGANHGTTQIGIFVGGYQIAVMGCNAHDSTSHNIRLHTAAKAVVTHNVMGGSNVGTYQHALKIHAPEFERDHSCESRWVHISDNRATYPAPWVISIGPQDGGSLERVSHVVLERNRTLGDPGTGRVQAGFEISARHVMMRNNILDGTGGSTGYSGATVQRRGIEPTPYNIRFLNNTVVRRDAGSSISALSMSSTDLAAVRNNIVWAPSVTTRNMLNGSPTNLTISNNLPVGTDPQCVDFAGQNYSLVSGASPAVDAGAALPEVFADFSGTPRPLGAGYDIGAHESY